MTQKMHVAETDNRDPSTTTLRLTDISEAELLVEVDVDPWELFENMLDNCEDGIMTDHSLFEAERDKLIALVTRIVGILAV